MTNWTNSTGTVTTWSDQAQVGTDWDVVPEVVTSYTGRGITNLGVTMDDMDYIMDDPIATMDDMYLQNIYAPVTPYADVAKSTTTWT